MWYKTFTPGDPKSDKTIERHAKDLVTAFIPNSTTQRVQDRYGPNKTSTEYIDEIKNEFLLDNDYNFTFFNNKGEWRAWRNPYNNRNDIGSMMDRYKSVWSVGVRSKVFWAIQDPDPTSEDLSLAHSATLCTGCYLSWIRSKQEDNKHVKLLLQEGVPHSQLFSRRIWEAPECIAYLVECGNETNACTTPVTCIEIWQSTQTVEADLKQVMDQNHWSRSGLTTPVWEKSYIKLAKHCTRTGG